jgi:hypothetical protein
MASVTINPNHGSESLFFFSLPSQSNSSTFCDASISRVEGENDPFDMYIRTGLPAGNMT